ncbi:DUF6338 family protein [Pseudonocardia sp. KRD291]|uniref:DUF6338 family protein n=1 Tax=Pseudonocardia sp. KRD291 TaxID=2792007 RepID=UPI001CF7D648
MLPTSIWIGAILLALVPGWLYTQLRERLSPRPPMSNLSELLSALSVGLATTGVGIALLVLIPHQWLPFLVDVDAWPSGGNVYLRGNAREAVWTVAVVLMLATAISLVLYIPQRLRRKTEFSANRSVWVSSLGARPKRQIPWVGIKLQDGSLIEGILYSYSVAERPPEERDITLQKPLRRTAPEPGCTPTPVQVDRAMFSGTNIAYVTVSNYPEKESRSRQARRSVYRWCAAQAAKLRRIDTRWKG